MVPTRQGGHQAAGLCVAICFGIGGGILVGKENPTATVILLCLKEVFTQCMTDSYDFALFRVYLKITYLGRCCG